MAKIKIGFLGCGRMGKLHMGNIINFASDKAEIVAVADPMIDKFGNTEWLNAHGITNLSNNVDDVINNPEVDAIFVCSSTDMHCPLSLRSIKAGKHTFCEKPITYDVPQLLELCEAVKASGKKFMCGFNRRWDHNHKAVADAVKAGKIGEPQLCTVSSRDPEPPTIEYVKVSGGLFYDMMIHDFDMVRYVTQSEAVEISAVGSCLINPKLQEESGVFDVDTAVVTMKMANGCIATINNSRQAVYGYDQRVEVFGSKGVVQDYNDLHNTASVMTVDGCVTERPLWFFLERYTQAFIDEARGFIDCIINNTEPETGVVDGLIPVLMAKAATESCKANGAWVKVDSYNV